MPWHFSLLWLERFLFWTETIKGGEWTYENVKPIQRLRGKTFGVCGFGAIAREAARKAQAFNMNVIAFDPYIDKKIAADIECQAG